jgi:Phage integrase, N-terminal SAM-like domain
VINALYHTLDEPGRGPVKVADIHRVTTDIILAPSPDLQPAPFFTPTPKAAKRVLEFFTGQINNDHTRRAYMNATRRFAAWCAQRNLDELSSVHPFHVAAFIEDLQAEVSPPTVKQHLAALRMLLDWLVTGHVIDVNPAHAVRGPKYVVKRARRPSSPPPKPARFSTASRS